MGRKKIKIEKIEEGRNRQVTFLKRKAGLFKKAYELATLTDSQVGVIVFGHNGRVSQFCSTDMDALLLRYTEFEGKIDSKGPEDFGKDEDEDEDGDEAPGDDGSRGPPGGASGSGSHSGASGSGGKNFDAAGQGSSGGRGQQRHWDPSTGNGQGGGSVGGKRKELAADVKVDSSVDGTPSHTTSSPVDKAAVKAAVRRRQRHKHRSTSSISTEAASVSEPVDQMHLEAHFGMTRPSTSTAVMGMRPTQEPVYPPAYGINARTMSGSNLPPMTHQYPYQPNGGPYIPLQAGSSSWQSHSVPLSRSTSSNASPAPAFPTLLRPTTADGLAITQMSSYASHFPPASPSAASLGSGYPSPHPSQQMQSPFGLPESALHPRGLGSARFPPQAHNASYIPAHPTGGARPLLSVMPPTNDTYASLSRSNNPASASSDSIAGPFSLARNASFEHTPSNAGTPPLHHPNSGNLSSTSSEQSIKDLLAGSGPSSASALNVAMGQTYPMGLASMPMQDALQGLAPPSMQDQQQMPPSHLQQQRFQQHHPQSQAHANTIKAPHPNTALSMGYGAQQDFATSGSSNAPYLFGGVPFQ